MNLRADYLAPILLTEEAEESTILEGSETCMLNDLQVHSVHHPRPFSGSADDDIDEWLESLSVVASANGWKEEDLLKRYSVYLKGAARSWFVSSCDANDPKDWTAAVKKMKAAFGAAKPELSNYERMSARQMVPGEPVATFFFDKLRLIKRYKPAMEKSEVVQHIIRSLTKPYYERIYGKTFDTPDKLYERLKTMDEANALSSNRTSYNQAMAVEEDRVMAATVSAKISEQAAEGFKRPVTPNFPRNRFRDYNKRGSGRSPFSPPRRDISEVRCYNCHELGHYATDCPKPRGESKNYQKFRDEQRVSFRN